VNVLAAGWAAKAIPSFSQCVVAGLGVSLIQQSWNSRVEAIRRSISATRCSAWSPGW